MKQAGNTATILPETLVEVPPHCEEVDAKLDKAREHLITLRRQQEELERQKSELEELRRKQEEYTRGRREILDHLTRGLVTLERQQTESQRLAELSGKAIATFREYAEQIQSINDEEWNSRNVREELSAALGVIEAARVEYNRARTKLDCLNPGQGEPGIALTPATDKQPLTWDDALRYLCLGAAASAPLILAGTIWLLVLIAQKH